MTYKGVVSRFGARGFGFIDAGRQSLFFSINDVVGRQLLQAGDRVEFQIQKDQQGRDKAIQVTLLTSPDRLDRQGVQREDHQ